MNEIVEKIKNLFTDIDVGINPDEYEEYSDSDYEDNYEEQMEKTNAYEAYAVVHQIILRWKLYRYIKNAYIEYNGNAWHQSVSFGGVLIKSFPIRKYRTIIGTEIRINVWNGLCDNYSEKILSGKFNLDEFDSIGEFTEDDELPGISLMIIPGKMQFDFHKN